MQHHRHKKIQKLNKVKQVKFRKWKSLDHQECFAGWSRQFDFNE